MLLGLIFPDNGKIFINGKEFDNRHRDLLQNIGAVIERPDMYNYLSGWDNLKTFAALSKKNIPLARLYEVLEQVGLRGREQDKVMGYSQGMKQRLGIAIAMTHNPDLLILDEPTNGLDPQGIVEIRNLVRSLSQDHGKTIMMSSHLLYEMEQLATDMLIINKGKKVVEGMVADLLDPDDTMIEVDIIENKSIADQVATSSWQQYLVSINLNTLIFKMNIKNTPDLNKWLVENNVSVMELRSKHSLEAYFLSLTNDTTTTDRTL